LDEIAVGKTAEDKDTVSLMERANLPGALAQLQLQQRSILEHKISKLKQQ